MALPQRQRPTTKRRADAICATRLPGQSARQTPTDHRHAARAVDSEVLEAPAQKVFSTVDFPANAAARPPLWPFRTYSDAKRWNCTWTPNGVLVMEVQVRGRGGLRRERSGSAAGPALQQARSGAHPRVDAVAWSTAAAC